MVPEGHDVKMGMSSVLLSALHPSLRASTYPFPLWLARNCGLKITQRALHPCVFKPSSLAFLLLYNFDFYYKNFIPVLLQLPVAIGA
jgi:hypothetical protein